MKCKLLIVSCGLLLSITNCNNQDSASSKPENDIDAARNFIRSALDGKFDQARKLLLPDSSNNNYMDVAERNYQKSDPNVKNGYRSASINIHQVSPVNDSTTIVIFSNSFINDHDTLKIRKVSGQWMVDLKYLYEHDMDSIQIITSSKDTIK